MGAASTSNALTGGLGSSSSRAVAESSARCHPGGEGNNGVGGAGAMAEGDSKLDGPVGMGPTKTPVKIPTALEERAASLNKELRVKEQDSAAPRRAAPAIRVGFYTYSSSSTPPHRPPPLPEPPPRALPPPTGD